MGKDEKKSKSLHAKKSKSENVDDVLKRHQLDLKKESVRDSTVNGRIQDAFNSVFKGNKKFTEENESLVVEKAKDSSEEEILVSDKKKEKAPVGAEVEDQKATVIFDITKLQNEVPTESHDISNLDISFSVSTENAQSKDDKKGFDGSVLIVDEKNKELDAEIEVSKSRETEIEGLEEDDEGLALEPHSFKGESKKNEQTSSTQKQIDKESEELSDEKVEELSELFSPAMTGEDSITSENELEINHGTSAEGRAPTFEGDPEEGSDLLKIDTEQLKQKEASELHFDAEQEVDISFNEDDHNESEKNAREKIESQDDAFPDEFPSDQEVIAQNFEEDATQTLSFVKSDLVDSNDESTEETRDIFSKNVKEIRQNSESFQAYHSEELFKLQAIIKNLRLERKELLSEIEKLEVKTFKMNQENLSFLAQNEELKIEVSILRRKHEEESELLKYRLKIAEETKTIVQEKMEKMKFELDLFNKKARIDVNKVRSHEKELESQLELLKDDTATQISMRDKKIIELKKEIDILKFDIDGMQEKEKEMRAEGSNSKEKMDKITLALKTTLGMLENSEFDEERKEILRKLRL